MIARRALGADTRRRRRAEPPCRIDENYRLGPRHTLDMSAHRRDVGAFVMIATPFLGAHREVEAFGVEVYEFDLVALVAHGRANRVTN